MIPPFAQDLLDRKTMYTDPVTGAQKEAGFVRPDLIPAIPQIILGAVYGMGASKYADFNWAKGYPWSLSIAAMERHIARFKAGEDNDPESGLPHLAHAAWHAMTLIHFMFFNADMDDRYKPTEPENPALRRAIDDEAGPITAPAKATELVADQLAPYQTHPQYDQVLAPHEVEPLTDRLYRPRADILTRARNILGDAAFEAWLAAPWRKV